MTMSRPQNCQRPSLMAGVAAVPAAVTALAVELMVGCRVRSTSDRLDALDHLVDRLVHRHLVAHDAVHCLGPNVLVVEDGELVVLREFEGHRAGSVLVVDRL